METTATPTAIASPAQPSMREELSALQIKKFFTADGFANFAARLGVSGQGADGCEDNLISHGHYEFNLVTRNRIQLEAAYRGSWIVGKVVKCIAEDMTREGVLVTTNEQAEVIPDFMVYMTRLKIMSAFKSTIQWGRLYGGAIGVYQIRNQDLSKPLQVDKIKKDDFRGITVYDRWQLAPVLTELIEEGPDMGLPKYYDIVSGTDINDPQKQPDFVGVNSGSTNRVRVHHSRCFRMIGMELPFFQAITEMLWGESVLENMWDRLISFDDATMNVAGLIHRANLRTIKFESLREIMAAGGDAQKGLEAQVEWMRQMQSNEGVTAMDMNDAFESYSYSFAGIPETLLQFAQQVSGAADIPLVRLFNQSPAGLNANGSADMIMYNDGIKSRQESMMRNPFSVLLRVMWRSFTGNPAPKDLAFEFIPLQQPTPTEKATNAKTTTDTVIEAHQEGLISTAGAMKELKQNSSESGLFTHITDEDIDEAENEEPPEPELDEPGEPGNPGVDPKAKKEKEPKTPPKLKAVGDSIAAVSSWGKIVKWFSRDTKSIRPAPAPMPRKVIVKAKVSDERKRIADWMAKNQ